MRRSLTILLLTAVLVMGLALPAFAANAASVNLGNGGCQNIANGQAPPAPFDVLHAVHGRTPLNGNFC